MKIDNDLKKMISESICINDVFLRGSFLDDNNKKYVFISNNYNDIINSLDDIYFSSLFNEKNTEVDIKEIKLSADEILSNIIDLLEKDMIYFCFCEKTNDTHNALFNYKCSKCIFNNTYDLYNNLKHKIRFTIKVNNHYDKLNMNSENFEYMKQDWILYIDNFSAVYLRYIYWTLNKNCNLMINSYEKYILHYIDSTIGKNKSNKLMLSFDYLSNQILFSIQKGYLDKTILLYLLCYYDDSFESKWIKNSNIINNMPVVNFKMKKEILDFDFKKLNSFNNKAIRSLSIIDIYKSFMHWSHLNKKEISICSDEFEKIYKLLDSKIIFTNWSDIVEKFDYLFMDLNYDFQIEQISNYFLSTINLKNLNIDSIFLDNEITVNTLTKEQKKALRYALTLQDKGIDLSIILKYFGKEKVSLIIRKFLDYYDDKLSLIKINPIYLNNFKCNFIDTSTNKLSDIVEEKKLNDFTHPFNHFSFKTCMRSEIYFFDDYKYYENTISGRTALKKLMRIICGCVSEINADTEVFRQMQSYISEQYIKKAIDYNFYDFLIKVFFVCKLIRDECKFYSNLNCSRLCARLIKNDRSMKILIVGEGHKCVEFYEEIKEKNLHEILWISSNNKLVINSLFGLSKAVEANNILFLTGDCLEKKLNEIDFIFIGDSFRDRFLTDANWKKINKNAIVFDLFFPSLKKYEKESNYKHTYNFDWSEIDDRVLLSNKGRVERFIELYLQYLFCQIPAEL